MCGACGRMVVADDVLGAERTLRAQFIVASTINGLREMVPGLPTVQVAGDGWTVRTSTGAVHTCPTVAVVWEALLSSTDRNGTTPVLLDGIRRQLPETAGLVEAVLDAGQKAAEGRQD
jgi:hypothetical protein